MLIIDGRNVRSIDSSPDGNRQSGACNLAPHFLLTLVQLIFSGWHLLGFLAIRSGANPLIFALYRETIASVLMVMYVLSRVNGNYWMVLIDYVDFKQFIFVGLCCFINVVGTVISLQYISPNRYAILQPAIPIITTAISCGMKLEKMTAMKTIGITVAALGAIITEAHSVIKSNEESGGNTQLGTVIVIIQCFSAANMIVFQKKLLRKYDPAVTTLVYYSIGTFFTVILCAVFSLRFVKEDFIFYGDKLAWIAVGYASTFATLFAYNATSWSNKRLNPSVTTVYNTLQPIGTVILSYLILSTAPSSAELIGGLVIILGLIVTVHDKSDDDQQDVGPDSQVGYQDYVPIFTTAIHSPQDISENLFIAMDIEYSQLLGDARSATLSVDGKEICEENSGNNENGEEVAICGREDKPTTPTAVPIDTTAGIRGDFSWP